MKLNEIKMLSESTEFITGLDEAIEYLKSVLLKFEPDELSMEADGTLNVNGNMSTGLFIDNDEMTPAPIGELKVKFGYVSGRFSLIGAGLTSMKGMPREVDGGFSVSNNPKLKSLKGGPEKVKKIYSATGCSLDSFEGLPKEIFGTLSLDKNNVEKFGKSLVTVHGELYLEANKFTSLEGIEDQFAFAEVPYLPGGALGISAVSSGLLSLFNIKGGLLDVMPDQSCSTEMREACKIVMKHLKNKDIFACQTELIDAGLEKFAEI